jgi:hypothetical protein
VLKRPVNDSELLDQPDGDPRLVEASYRMMRLVNRIGGGTGVVARFLAGELAGSGTCGRIRVLDLGAGPCDIPLAAARWLRGRGLRVEFTCLDQNVLALELARQSLVRTGCSAIRLVRGDAFTYRPAETHEYAVASMTVHHFTPDQIVTLIHHLKGFVTRALLINDLQRSALNTLACRILSLGRDPVVRHDALLSVRRGFRPADLSAILASSGVPFKVTTAWFCRVVAVVRFDGGASR